MQHVRQILVDCDGDTILLKVEQQGAACHEGYRSCFFRELTPDGVEVIAEKLVNPEDVYTARSSAKQVLPQEQRRKESNDG